MFKKITETDIMNLMKVNETITKGIEDIENMNIDSIKYLDEDETFVDIFPAENFSAIEIDGKVYRVHITIEVERRL